MIFVNTRYTARTTPAGQAEVGASALAHHQQGGDEENQGTDDIPIGS
jgi:hypothetical protein